MHSSPRVGTCHLCGNYGKLSFDHVPPQAAFNNKRVFSITLEEALSLGPDEKVRGPQQQGGAGYHSLCEKCNNDTGHWYGSRFVAWCYQGMELLVRTNGKPSLIYLNYMFPLSILKQIIAMFFSINPDLRLRCPDLVPFVLQKENKYLRPEYSFYVYYNASSRLKYLPFSVIANISTKEMRLVSEITYPPFGYLFTINSPPPDERLFDISFFSRYEYNRFVVLPLRLPVLPTASPLPGDYRTKEEIEETMAENLKFMPKKTP